jgi:hypothetical protein
MPCTSMEVCLKPIHFGGTHAYAHTIIRISNCKLCKATMEVCLKLIHLVEHIYTHTKLYALAIASFAVHIHGGLPQAYTFGGTHAHTHTIIRISNCKLCRAHPWSSASSLYIWRNTCTHAHNHTHKQLQALPCTSMEVCLKLIHSVEHIYTHKIIRISNCKLCRAHPWRSASSLYIRWNTCTHTHAHIHAQIHTHAHREQHA